MKTIRRLIGLVIVLGLLAGLWLWWNRAPRVNMTAYVPADSLVYLEANSMPDILAALSNTDAWKSAAPSAGIRSGLSEVGWLSRLSAWTGIGPADAVVFSRSQVAVAVMGIDAADGGEALRVKPRVAVVVETHSSAARARSAIEKRIGAFARHAYGDPKVEQRDLDGAAWIIWTGTGDRKIMAAMKDSVAVLGNDEQSIRACLAVRRGERPSLAGNTELEDMRRRVSRNNALAFGYASPLGAARLFEVAATLYIGQVTQDPQIQSLLASVLPTIGRRTLGSVGWSTNESLGSIEDRYFVTIQNHATSSLKQAMTTPAVPTWATADLLPADTTSISRYRSIDPESAWRALNYALASQLDAVAAMLVPAVLKAALPQGVADVETFLRAIGPEFVTARSGDGSQGSITIVEVRDEQALREFVYLRLGTRTPNSETIGDSALLSSSDPKRGGAAFVANHMIVASTENVRRCLEARRQGQTLAQTDAFKQAARMISDAEPAHVVTFTSDASAVRNFLSFVAEQKAARGEAPNLQALDGALGRLAYAASETLVNDDGIERRTRSGFGMLGVLATQLSAKR